jgi:hypothetical protein
MWKYAGELRVGDVWTERTKGRAPASYRIVRIEPGLAPVTVRVKAVSAITGKQRTFDFFLVNRVKIHEEPASNGASLGCACRS